MTQASTAARELPKFGTPGPLGLAGFGPTTWVLSAINAGLARGVSGWARRWGGWAGYVGLLTGIDALVVAFVERLRPWLAGSWSGWESL